MQVHNLVQGSPEWHAYRRNHFNASDAPAMMGCSPYKTRTELISELATGITPEVDAATQAVFDAGHRFEELARPLAEQIIGEELAPTVGSEGKLSASFDGLTLMEDTGFEHKSLNKALREAMFDGCTGADLPMVYRVQMEQQCMVAGAARILFMASKWEGDTLIEERHCWYEPDLALRAKIVAGWAQLEADVAAYVPEAPKPAPVVAAPMETLPAVSVQVQGGLSIVSNLPAFGDALKAFIDRIPTDPSTDQEFADTEAACKALKRAEDALEASESNALAQLADVDTMRRFVADYRALARTTRLQREKLVAQRKEEIRGEIVAGGVAALREHIAGLNTRLGKPYMPAVPADFAGVIKGKRSVDSLRSAVNDELARAKIASNEIADRIQVNLSTLRDLASAHTFLFADTSTIVLKEPEDLTVLVKSRIAEHQAKEAARIEAERERIRREEAERADREARERLQAEGQATQASITQAAQQGLLADPLAADLGALAADKTSEAVAAIDARQVIGAAQARAAAPQQADDGATITLGQLNTLLAPVKLDAAGLEALGFTTTRVKAAVHFPAVLFPALCRAIAKRAMDAAAAGVTAAEVA